MAESVVKSAALLLGKLLAEEISHLDDVRDKVEELQTELTTLAAFLMEAVETRRQDEVMRTVLSDARNVAYDCEDVIETYILKVARCGYEEYEGFQLGSVLRWAFLVWNAASVHKIHSKIGKLNRRMSALKSRMTAFGVSDPNINAPENSIIGPLRRIYSHENEEYVVVGIENHLTELVRRLTTPDDKTVIVLCGMGGIGKSTLARELYHHRELRRDGGYFKAFGWCHVSQKFNPNSVLLEIMYSLVPENDLERRTKIIESINANRAHETLYKLMKDEKCLVVLDDVWTSNDWAMLQPAFPRKTKTGSRIVLTTRNEKTLSRLDPDQVYLHPIKGLDETKSWELFEMIAFSGPACTDLTKKEVGLEMLRHCNGVPLAIVVLGQVLKRKERVQDWKQMRNDVVTQINRGGAPRVPYKEVYDVLQVSYDELPFHLKQCFLHLANYPEDYEIPRGKLFQLWIGEGIVSKEGPDELEDTEDDVAERYLNELVSRNMVQVASRAGGTGEIASCRLHDLMRDICIEIANREGFLQIINCKSDDNILMTCLPKRDKRLRRLAIYVNDQEPRSSTLPNTVVLTSAKVSRAPNLRSLLLFSVDKKRGDENCKDFVETICKDFPLLRVFDCENFQIQGKMPKQVGDLIHLRHLCLYSSRVTELPSSIQNLRWLQTLDLRVDARVVLSLPNILWKMKQLRHLYLPYYGGLGMLEKERMARAPKRYVIKRGEVLRLDGLRNLQTLIFVDLDRVALQGLSDLERMKTICATCETTKEALYPFLQCSSLRSFMLKVHARIINEEPEILSSCEVMHHLDLHVEPDETSFSLTKSLYLAMLPKSLVRIDIWYLQLAADPLPVLEKLPNLSHLGLHVCYHGNKMVCSAGGFPELIDLRFDELWEFHYWEVEEGALQKLKTLLMINCPVEKIPDALPRSVNKKIYINFIENVLTQRDHGGRLAVGD